MPGFGHIRMPQGPELNGRNVQLVVRQQPVNGLVTTTKKEKNRKPLDPPPILQLKVSDQHMDSAWLVSPYLFVVANLLEGEAGGERLIGEKYMIGASSSSLHRLKDVDNSDGGFFVFGDISIKQTGKYRLRFNLFNYDKSGENNVEFITHVESAVFTVYNQKEFPGIRESSVLSRTFSDQGVRLRLRKEARPAAGKKRTFEALDLVPAVDKSPGGAIGGSQYSLADSVDYKRRQLHHDYSLNRHERYSQSNYAYPQQNIMHNSYGGNYMSYDQQSPTYQLGRDYTTTNMSGGYPDHGASHTDMYSGMARLNTQRPPAVGSASYPLTTSQSAMDQMGFLSSYPTPTSAHQQGHVPQLSHSSDDDSFGRAQPQEVQPFLPQDNSYAGSFGNANNEIMRRPSQQSLIANSIGLPSDRSIATTTSSATTGALSTTNDYLQGMYSHSDDVKLVSSPDHDTYGAVAGRPPQVLPREPRYMPSGLTTVGGTPIEHSHHQQAPSYSGSDSSLPPQPQQQSVHDYSYQTQLPNYPTLTPATQQPSQPSQSMYNFNPLPPG
ncbi:hypothetical protein LTS14_007364 [Recurvomyces mirabilis]|uniref:uncharacterized protein n=1 Tax=Recurvomyces mirabilis TaxID=574656 RepID=UPI002DE1952B|nr:hypothetical protein LTS14_007364 [Recurvomyces mirabilis]